MTVEQWMKEHAKEIEERRLISEQIGEKKRLLCKYREDVEQVDLFGMERADYNDKKLMCVQLVTELRELEKLLSL